MTINNLQYLKGFFEACYGQKQSVTFDADKVADILDHINGAIVEASVSDKTIPALQPVQIPLFPQVPFTPYQPTVTPNWPTPQWPGINQQDKYFWVQDPHKITCDTMGNTNSVVSDSTCCRDPFELDASTLSVYHDPLPAVSAEKLAAIIRDETRAQKLEERRARSDERTANYGRPLKGHARD